MANFSVGPPPCLSDLELVPAHSHLLFASTLLLFTSPWHDRDFVQYRIHSTASTSISSVYLFADNHECPHDHTRFLHFYLINQYFPDQCILIKSRVTSSKATMSTNHLLKLCLRYRLFDFDRISPTYCSMDTLYIAMHGAVPSKTDTVAYERLQSGWMLHPTQLSFQPWHRVA